MQIHGPMSLIIVAMKVWTVSSPQLVYVKQLRFSVVVITSDSETSTREEESSEPENCDNKLVMCGVKLIKNQAMSLSLEPQV